MITLSGRQVDTVRLWLSAEGISREDLSLDLLDHVCCLIETRMTAGESFELAFEKTMDIFVPAAGVKSIQTEILLTTQLKSIIMKKAIIVLALTGLFLYFLGTLLFASGAIANTTPLIRDGIAFTTQLLICAVVLPLYWYEQNRQWQNSAAGFGAASRSFAIAVGFVCSLALVNAFFFKLMHFPGGDQLFVIAAISGMMFVPFYGLRKFRLG